MNQPSIDDLFASAGPPALKFPSIGTKYAGEIQQLVLRQQRQFDSGELLTWDDGSPKMELVITLTVGHEDRRLFVKGQMFSAIKEAVHRAGQVAPKVGGRLAVAYTEDGEARKGLNPPKIYQAVYTPPTVTEMESAFTEPRPREDKAASDSQGLDVEGLAALLGQA